MKQVTNPHPPSHETNYKPFKACAKKCNQCLFTDAKIVSDERKKEIIKACLDEQNHFGCHKFGIEGKGVDVCCRGFYDAYKNKVFKLVVFTKFELIEFIEEKL